VSKSRDVYVPAFFVDRERAEDHIVRLLSLSEHLAEYAAQLDDPEDEAAVLGWRSAVRSYLWRLEDAVARPN
jgi:hypothetical protein